MQPERTGPFIVAGCATALVLAVTVGVPSAALEIRHSLRARYNARLTRAYQECVVPNDTSSDGIPACRPPVTSSCDYARGRVTVEGLKTSPVTPSVRVQLDLDNVSGPGSCTSGPYRAIFSLRVTADDSACASGQCTWIDADLQIPLTRDTDDFVIDDLILERFMETSHAIAPSHVANYEILGVTVIAPDNLPIAAVGVGNHDADSFRSGVSVRYVECVVPDTANTSGVPACSAPTWGASCDFITGEIRLNDSSSAPVPEVRGLFTGVGGASPLCSDGTYEIATVLRATGPVCNGAPCTLMDTPVVVPVAAVAAAISDGASLDTVGLAGPLDSVEIREAVLRDPLGEPVASPGVTNAYLLLKPAVRIGFRDSANLVDDDLTLRAKFPHPYPPIDPTVAGATFTVTDQNGTVYSATIPASAWVVLEPGVTWRYEDRAGVLAGIRGASIRGGRAGVSIKLKAKDVNLTAADLPSVNFAVTVSNTDSGTSIGMRNAACARGPKGFNCRVKE